MIIHVESGWFEPVGGYAGAHTITELAFTPKERSASQM
jgi:hypothetical protein